MEMTAFSLTGVNVMGDGAMKYESSDENVLTRGYTGTGDHQRCRFCRGKASPWQTERITLAQAHRQREGSPLKRNTHPYLNRCEPEYQVQPEGILGTYEDDFDIIAKYSGSVW